MRLRSAWSLGGGVIQLGAKTLGQGMCENLALLGALHCGALSLGRRFPERCAQSAVCLADYARCARSLALGVFYPNLELVDLLSLLLGLGLLASKHASQLLQHLF